MLEDRWVSFRKLLDSEYDWPSRYLFKFIVPRKGISEVERLFKDEKLKIRASKKGNYLSVTAHIQADSADAIIDIYKSASTIPGIISL